MAPFDRVGASIPVCNVMAATREAEAKAFAGLVDTVRRDFPGLLVTVVT
ncbi:hypothetical protein [Peterkaempfera sp. SMS 1(5)a]